MAAVYWCRNERRSLTSHCLLIAACSRFEHIIISILFAMIPWWRALDLCWSAVRGFWRTLTVMQAMPIVNIGSLFIQLCELAATIVPKDVLIEGKWNANCFDKRIIVSAIFVTNVLLQCQDLLWRLVGSWTDGWTEEAMWRLHLRHFLTFYRPNQGPRVRLFWSRMHRKVCQMRLNIFISGMRAPELSLSPFLVECDVISVKEIVYFRLYS